LEINDETAGALLRRVGRTKPGSRLLDELSEPQVVAVVAAMKSVAELGLADARHLRGDVYEVRVAHRGQAFCVLFSPEGRNGQILLALDGFDKTTQETPLHLIRLAEARLLDWRNPARPLSS
jgi:phage-related protein